MLRKALFAAAAAVSMFSVANVEASDRFSLGLNLGGGYPVYQPAPVIVNPYPTVYPQNYGYTPSYGYGSSYGNYGYANPGVSFNYSNGYNSYRPVRPSYNSNNFRGSSHQYGHLHHHDHGHHHGRR